MVVGQWGKVLDVTVVELVVGPLQVGKCPVGVSGVEQGQQVEDEAEGAQLGLLAGPVRLVEVPSVPVEHGAGESMTGFLAVELAVYPASEPFVGDVVEHGDRAHHAPDLADRPGQWGRLAAALESSDEFRSRRSSGVEGGRHPADVIPVGGDQASADAVAGHPIERSVVNAGVEPPVTPVGQVGEARGELVAEEPE